MSRIVNKERERGKEKRKYIRIGKRPSEKESADGEILRCARIRVEEQEAEIAA